MDDKIVELFSSRKFIVSLLCVVCVVLLAIFGQITGTEATEFSKWVLGFWLVAQAATDTMKMVKPR